MLFFFFLSQCTLSATTARVPAHRVARQALPRRVTPGVRRVQAADHLSLRDHPRSAPSIVAAQHSTDAVPLFCNGAFYRTLVKFRWVVFFAAPPVSSGAPAGATVERACCCSWGGWGLKVFEALLVAVGRRDVHLLLLVTAQPKGATRRRRRLWRVASTQPNGARGSSEGRARCTRWHGSRLRRRAWMRGGEHGILSGGGAHLFLGVSKRVRKTERSNPSCEGA